MKILLVIPKYEIIPVGAAYIYTSLKQAGYCVDSFIFEDNPDALSARLKEKKPDFVAMGGLSIEYNRLKAISSTVKKFDIKIIAGGGIITSEPELMSRPLNVDYAVIGEGEEAIIELLSCIEDSGDLSLVDGIGYFNGNEFILTKPRKPIENLDSLPFPDYEGLGFVKYLDSLKPSSQYYLDIFDYPREYPILTSRSCPFLCTFCYHPVGNNYRQRSINSIMAELETAIPKYHINMVSIYDELFSSDEQRVHDFCKRLKEYTKTLSWEVKWGCQMRVDALRDSLLDEMRDAGCFSISYGFESYSPAVLESMKKYISPQQIHHAIHATLDRGISIQANFIFGDRAETLQTAATTLDFWKEHPDAGLYFIVVCPKSELYQYAIEKGLIKDKIDYMANHMYGLLNVTDMSDADFSKLQRLVFKYYNNYSPCAIPIKLTDSNITLRCPLCKKVTEYNNFTNTISRDIISDQRFYCRKCRRRFLTFSGLNVPDSASLINRIYHIFLNLIIFCCREKFLILIQRKIRLIYYYYYLFSVYSYKSESLLLRCLIYCLKSLKRIYRKLKNGGEKK